MNVVQNARELLELGEPPTSLPASHAQGGHTLMINAANNDTELAETICVLCEQGPKDNAPLLGADPYLVRAWLCDSTQTDEECADYFVHLDCADAYAREVAEEQWTYLMGSTRKDEELAGSSR